MKEVLCTEKVQRGFVSYAALCEAKRYFCEQILILPHDLRLTGSPRHELENTPCTTLCQF